MAGILLISRFLFIFVPWWWLSKILSQGTKLPTVLPSVMITIGKIQVSIWVKSKKKKKKVPKHIVECLSLLTDKPYSQDKITVRSHCTAYAYQVV